MSKRVKYIVGRKPSGDQVTVWLVGTVSELPLSEVKQGDVALVIEDGLFYQRDINSSGWTLKYDPSDAVGSVDAEDVAGLQAAVESFLTEELDAKADLVHTHAQSDITNLTTDLAGKAASVHSHSGLAPAGGSAGQVLKKVSGTNYDYTWDDDETGQASGTAWGDITGTLSNQTDLQTALDGKAASSHSHAISDVTNLQSSLDGKAASSHTHTIANVTSLQSSLDGKAASSHSHAIGDVTNLQSTLDGKAASSHTHAIGDVTNLQTTLDGKALSSHNHAASAINSGTLDTARLGSGTANGTTFLRGDQTWAAPAGSSVVGYCLNLSAANQATTTDAQTIFWGLPSKAPDTTGGTHRVYIPKAGSIKAAYVYCNAGTAGTAESWTVSIRLNNTTNISLGAQALSNVSRVWSSTALNTAVVAGDYIEITTTCPTWVTNPANLRWGASVYIE